MWYGKHQGVDFQAAQGSSLREFVGGTVSSTGWYPWGGEIDVSVPGGLTERYLHLSGIGVKKGQHLERGQPIGATGGGTPQSGLGYWSSGSHLHAQYDHGDYQGGISPWGVWRAFGDMNLSQYIGGSSAVGSFFRGGVATKPQFAHIAEVEPEAIIPLSKLSDVLKNLSIPKDTQQSTTQVQPKQVIHIQGNLVGSVSINVNGNGSGGLSDQDKDDIMHQALSVFEEALAQLNGKL